MNATRFASCFVYAEDSKLSAAAVTHTRTKQLLAGRNARAIARAHQPNRSPRVKFRRQRPPRAHGPQRRSCSSSRRSAATNDAIESVLRACPSDAVATLASVPQQIVRSFFRFPNREYFFCPSRLSFQLASPRIRESQSRSLCRRDL